MTRFLPKHAQRQSKERITKYHCFKFTNLHEAITAVRAPDTETGWITFTAQMKALALFSPFSRTIGRNYLGTQWDALLSSRNSAYSLTCTEENKLGTSEDS